MGDVGEDDPDGIGLADCATLLGQARLRLWVRSKLGKFASSAGTRNGRPFWNEDEVYRWAASARPKLIRRIPIRYWPDAKRPAIYLGAHEIGDAEAQTWRTNAGTVCVLWPLPGRSGGPPPHRVAAQVIFDRPIWVRTEDGRLYPAPKDSYWGLNWGYPGSGPGSLALLISRLLDNITARGADNATGAPAGLEKLTQTEWPRGTVFTRAQLEAARDGRPYPEE